MKTYLNKPIVRYTALLLTGLVLGALLFGGRGHDHDDPSAGAGASAPADPHAGHNHGPADEQTVWTCSMHPQIRSDEPGSCPLCGMDLTRAAAGGAEDAFTLSMTAEAVALAQIITAPVTMQVPVREIRLPGRVVIPEEQRSVVTAATPGRITRQYVAAVGQSVRRGEPLLQVWSPEIVTAQQELLDVLAQPELGSQRMLEAARSRLRYFGLTSGQIAELEASGEVQREVTILAPSSGILTARMVAENDFVDRGAVLYEIASLSRVWMDFEAREQDLSWLKAGDVVAYRSPAHPGRSFAGRVQWVDPVVQPDSRTVRIRLETDNADAIWKPDMLVSGVVLAESPDRQPALTVPASAVLWTGTRSLVYVDVAEAEAPAFESREVELGPRFGDRFVVLDGLRQDERVVSNGVFTVDAEFQLRDKVSMMNRRTTSARATTAASSVGMVSTVMSGSGAITSAGQSVGGAGAAAQAADQPPNHAAGTPAFRRDFTALLTTYLQAKDALVASDADAAYEAATALAEGIRALEEGDLSGDAATAWLTYRESLRRGMLNWLASADIEQQRTRLFEISEVLYQAALALGVDGVIYQQYCPMAFNDTGATWLSAGQQIRNPYLPETMLGCGEVLDVVGR